jgi:hypothetical protein
VRNSELIPEETTGAPRATLNKKIKIEEFTARAKVYSKVNRPPPTGYELTHVVLGRSV